MANGSSLTYDFSGYHTKFDKNAVTYSATGELAADYRDTGVAGVEKTNNIWAISGTYNTSAHNLMLAYQQNTGNVGYDYGLVNRYTGDGDITRHRSQFNIGVAYLF